MRQVIRIDLNKVGDERNDPHDAVCHSCTVHGSDLLACSESEFDLVKL
jgi:hypothetical protein